MSRRPLRRRPGARRGPPPRSLPSLSSPPCTAGVGAARSRCRSAPASDACACRHGRHHPSA
eukprot:5241063-Prymnesium_polylepis.1